MPCPSNALKYTWETYELAVKEHGWYYIPVAIHVMLKHGWQFVQEFDLPFSYMSEECGETCNKLYRYLREHHCRKDSRRHAMLDLMVGRMVASDPLISLLIMAAESAKSRVYTPKEDFTLHSEVVTLLQCEIKSHDSGNGGGSGGDGNRYDSNLEQSHRRFQKELSAASTVVAPVPTTTVAQFVDSCLRPDIGMRVPIGDVYQVYQDWEKRLPALCLDEFTTALKTSFKVQDNLLFG
eukprot:Lithocolla_globosa_v1_NODE_1386_length_2616_cov_35.702850.p1 type:complete len:237 gc:universal NODE_1386_length_2616_cov_35.702850:1536-2246(+)